MKILSAEFLTSAAKASQYPPANLPEVAFAGPSNVGKSSLINTLVNRKHLVKTSSTPGRTQLINFFDINNQIRFVDLPGYGYARAPEAVRRNWGPMIETYLSTRRTLKSVVAIADIRRRPRQQELALMDWLDHYAIPCIFVLTKADKLSKTQQTKQRETAAQMLSIDQTDIILFSAKSRLGRDVLWDAILNLVEPQLSENR
jgi:GTP-binding protein